MRMMPAGQNVHAQIGNAGVAFLHIGPFHQITVRAANEQRGRCNPIHVGQDLRLAQIQRRHKAQAGISAPAKPAVHWLKPPFNQNRRRRPR